MNSCVNVVVVDWSKGAKTLYPQAVSNIYLVARIIARLIRKICQFEKISASTFHCLGHSLGAHTCGLVGKLFHNPHIGRITGLDPAGPRFYLKKNDTRLSPNDADFVDVLHTNAGKSVFSGLGIESTLGRIDFYPNGGGLQPGCVNSGKNLSFSVAFKNIFISF